MHYVHAAMENKAPQALSIHFRQANVWGRYTAIAFGEFGFLNESALQKRTETEKGTLWIHTHIHTHIILYHSKKLSVELLFFRHPGSRA